MGECNKNCSYCDKDFAEAMSCPHHLELLKQIEAQAAEKITEHRKHPEEEIEPV